MKIHYNKAFSLLLVTLIYLFAIGLIEAIVFFSPTHLHPYVVFSTALFSGAIFIFLFSRLLKNSSVFDPYWSIAPMVFVFYFLSISNPQSSSFRQILIISAVLLWGLRLTLNWARKWPGMVHEDWRFRELKSGNKLKAFLLDFLGIHLFQTFQIFLGMLPLYPAISLSTRDANGFDILAFALASAGMVISLIADEQLRIFTEKNTEKGAFIKSGLWRFSRHPNYLGEALFWFGIYVGGLSAEPDYAWTIIGCLAIGLMLRYISIPMMEKHLLKTRPLYAQYQKEVAPFLPLNFLKKLKD